MFGNGDVAQLAERLICIQEVAGSTPVISTKVFDGFFIGMGNRLKIGFILACSLENEPIIVRKLSSLLFFYKESFIFDNSRRGKVIFDN